MRHKLCKRYSEKIHCVTERYHGGDDRHSRRGNKYYCHDYKWQDCSDSSCHNKYDKHKKKREERTSSDRGDKAFKPCSVHEPNSKHTSEQCYKNPKNNKRQVQDKNINTRCITTTHATQVTMTSGALASIHQSQVRTWRQPLARAKKPTRMRIIIFILIKKWRQVAMCLVIVSLTIDGMGPSPSWVKRVKRGKRVLLSWTMISILRTPS